MAIYVPRNLYRGVNPHLNSLLQSTGTEGDLSRFPSFHAAFIIYILTYLNAHLPPNYVAFAEESLQLVGLDDPTLVKNPKPDVAVRKTRTGLPQTAIATTPTPTWEGEIEDAVDLLKAVRVCLVEKSKIGRTVASFELLPPSSKPGGSHYGAYRIKRSEYMRAGIPLVEIDLLHERRPVVPNMPVYPNHDDSHPYYIAISDPRPNQGKTRTYGFDVNQPLPILKIPLAGEEAVIVDFDKIYDDLYSQTRLYILADYSELPDRFETYSTADQQRIRTRMSEIAQEYSETS